MILGQFAGGPAVRTDYNQTDPSKADYLVGRESIANHLANENNPHGVTAAQVGALPITGGTVDGEFKVGSGITMWDSTSEGGNLRLTPVAGKTSDYWEMDAFDGHLRFHTMKNSTDPDGAGSKTALKMYTDGSIGTGNIEKTRERLGAAPVGYGLGTLGKYVNSPDDAVVGGFYSAPVPSEIASSGTMRGFVFANSESWVTQIWSFNGSLIKRELESGAWKPYEWIDPPMQVGKEYRTTERYEGEVVYAKRISYTPSSAIGSTSGTTDVSIPHNITNINKRVRAFGRHNDTYFLPMTVSGGGSVSICYVGGGTVGLRMHNTTITGTFLFDLYYTKTS